MSGDLLWSRWGTPYPHLLTIQPNLTRAFQPVQEEEALPQSLLNTGSLNDIRLDVCLVKYRIQNTERR